MRMNATSRTPKRARSSVPTNVSLDAGLVREARELGINISRAAGSGLEQAVAKARAERWQNENRGALHSSNAFVDSHGLPLRSLRKFLAFARVAQFDVHQLKSGRGLVIDCQSDLLGDLNSRFVVPILPRQDAPQPAN